MKFLEIFRFHFGYQARRPSTWLYVALLLVIASVLTRGYRADALEGGFFVNSPFVIATVMVLGSLFWFLMAAATGGETAARDVATRIHPLTYSSPVTKTHYLGGRYLAALVLNASILLALPAGILLAVHVPGVEAPLIGPFRFAAYLLAYGFVALPTALLGTAVHFSWAALSGRPIAGYAGSVLVFFAAYSGMVVLGFLVGRQDLALLLDVFGHVFITSELTEGWTPSEKSTRLIGLEGPLLWSRLVWVGIALGTIAITYYRFRFNHEAPRPWWHRVVRRRSHAATTAISDPHTKAISVPRVHRAFGFGTSVRQTLAITWDSFRAIAMNRSGLVLLGSIAAVAVVIVPVHLHNMGPQVLPRTEHVLSFFTAPLTSFVMPWVVVPMLIVLYAGELVWRERDAGLSEIVDAAPVGEWAVLLGKFAGLGLVLVAWVALVTMAGVLIQVRMGYYDFELGLYVRVLLGLQLPEYLLFALLAVVVQALSAQKFVGHLAALVAYAFILFADRLGMGHHLLVYGSVPGWSYTDIAGFGPTLGSRMWFMSYWAAWALLLAVVATLLWMRGAEIEPRIRLRLARRRLTHPTALAAAVAVSFILILASYTLISTDVRKEDSTAPRTMEGAPLGSLPSKPEALEGRHG